MDDFSFDKQSGRFTSGPDKKKIFYTLGGVVFLMILYFLFLSVPADFIPGTIVKVEKGSSLRGVSFVLQKENIIRSRVVFESFAIILGGDKNVISAEYLFEEKLPVFEVARRILRGEHHMALIPITIPEGFDLKQIGDVFDAKLANFDEERFLLEAKGKEGYLFPDTYFFLINDDGANAPQIMHDNFKKKITSLSGDIISSGKTEKEIITMASIIEKESKGDQDREVISGILWRRISIGMPLQADAAPETYKNRGLPKSPIGNPGLLAIRAAIFPKSSPYLYYLHDKNGNIHYAKSFTEHKQNIVKYLK